MLQAWIAHHYSFAGTDHQIGDANGVLPRESLAVVREADDLVRAVRVTCARRLWSARARKHERFARAQEALQARAAAVEQATQRRVLGDVQSLVQALKQERDTLQEALEQLLHAAGRAALGQLLLEVPAAWPARSSIQLAMADWSRQRLKGEATLLLHPDDLAELDNLPETLTATGWTVSPDASLSRGDCVLAHDAGTVHASYRANVRALCDSFAAAAAAAPAPDVDAASSLASPPLPLHLPQEPQP